MLLDEDQPRLLVIRERDVGLFSMVLQVLNTLFLLEEQKIDRIPVALFGRGILYFQAVGYEGRSNVWEYYFEPLVPGIGEECVLSALGPKSFELLGSKRKWLELERGSIEFPQDLHLLAPLDATDWANLAQLDQLVLPRDWAWTESFHPTVDGRSLESFNIPRDSAADLIRRYVRPREHIRLKAAEIYDSYLKGHYVIGVHVRGTDGHGAPARGVTIPFDRYFAEIEQKSRELGDEACRVFLATDEQAIVSLFEDRLRDRLVYLDTVRKVDGDEVFGVGPTGQVMPGYIAAGGELAVKNGEAAVVEYTLLCKSQFLLHNVSSLSRAAAFCVPESVHL